ncbi:beta-ketoacyl-ACP synthase [Merismopedia glauca]|uniref:3-oxoacyl-ACP synthase n=1 Tax=Merismopedia glauca CCAP 1448/3 TaxID=1296344 RepID=A0A2T1C060_9CYAN|nr:beta-ketoacyl-ACP synthase [Merismopedia glauca]PSB01660.1 3-oxoacyl-ACP synthase [Merismopedia glauca CCAP 1448/3]
MSYEIVVTGIGIVCALGNTVDVVWRRLLAGETGISRWQICPELPSYPLGLVNLKQSPDMLLQQALNMALSDAGWDLPLNDCGVAIASSRGYQAIWEKWAAGSDLKYLSGLWLDSLPHMLAVQVARKLGTNGPVASPMSACTSGLWAIAHGVEWLQTGICRRVIVGATESCITPLNLTGFTQIGALATNGAYPFDKNREGMVLGEGAAVLLLEALPRGKSYPQKAYGQVLGFAFSNDAYHPTAPNPDYHLAAKTIKLCLERSGVSLESVGYIHAHGTGTRLNDSREAQLIQTRFPQKVPVSSTKGATGHTLGASGMLGAAFTLLALQQQVLPPCVGLMEPEFDLDFVLEARHQPIETALCLGFGFGGQNSVLAMGKYI